MRLQLASQTGTPPRAPVHAVVTPCTPAWVPISPTRLEDQPSRWSHPRRGSAGHACAGVRRSRFVRFSGPPQLPCSKGAVYKGSFVVHPGVRLARLCRGRRSRFVRFSVPPQLPGRVSAHDHLRGFTGAAAGVHLRVSPPAAGRWRLELSVIHPPRRSWPDSIESKQPAIPWTT